MALALEAKASNVDGDTVYGWSYGSNLYSVHECIVKALVDSNPARMIRMKPNKRTLILFITSPWFAFTVFPIFQLTIQSLLFHEPLNVVGEFQSQCNNS